MSKPTSARIMTLITPLWWVFQTFGCDSSFCFSVIQSYSFLHLASDYLCLCVVPKYLYSHLYFYSKPRYLKPRYLWHLCKLVFFCLTTCCWFKIWYYLVEYLITKLQIVHSVLKCDVHIDLDIYVQWTQRAWQWWQHYNIPWQPHSVGK